MITITSGGSSVIRGGVQGGYTLPEGVTHERRCLGVRAPHIFLRKLRRDSILSEQQSKINKTLETTFACCCSKCNMLHEYGEKT